MFIYLRSHHSGGVFRTDDRSTTAEGSPVLGVLMLGVITIALAAVVGTMGFGPTGGGGFSGASVRADFDRGHSEVGATLVDDRRADYVNVSVYGYGSGIKARLGGSGASLTVGTDDTARLDGDGRIYDLDGDAVATVDGRTARLHDGEGLPKKGTVTVRAVAVQDGRRRVVLDTDGSL